MENKTDNGRADYFFEVLNGAGLKNSITAHSGVYYTSFESHYYIYQSNFSIYWHRVYSNHRKVTELLTKKIKINYTDNQQNSYKRGKNLPVLARFLNYLFRHGLKGKTLCALNKGLGEFYFYFYFYSRGAMLTFKEYKNSLDIVETFDNFYRFGGILSFLITELEPFFYLRVKRVEKRFRKKFKTRFTSQIEYINPKKRSNLAFKALAYYTKLFSQYDVHARIGQGLFKTLMDKKKSYLFKRKIFMYSRVLKKFQKAVF